MQRLICLLGCLITFTVSAQEARNDTGHTYPKIESYPIDITSDAKCEADCGFHYRLPPEQLKRLRELESRAPGTIIRMKPHDEEKDPHKQNRLREY